jgi:cell division protein DivIC
MKTAKTVFRVLSNKYLLTVILVSGWVIFLDKNNVFSQMDLAAELKALETEKKYFLEQINKNREALTNLRTSPSNLEKFAREKYLMKKDNEDIFVIVPADTLVQGTN